MSPICCSWTNRPPPSIQQQRKIFERRSANLRVDGTAASCGRRTTCMKSRMYAIGCSFFRVEKFSWKEIPEHCRASTARKRSKNSSLRWHANDGKPDCRHRIAAFLSCERKSGAHAAVVCVGG